MKAQVILLLSLLTIWHIYSKYMKRNEETPIIFYYLNNEKIHRTIFLGHKDNFNFRNCYIQLTHSN